MTIVYRCKNCGYVLYVYLSKDINSYGVMTPSEVMSRYGGICPNCGKPLEKPSIDDIVIRQYSDGTREELERIRIISTHGGINRAINYFLKPVRIDLSPLDIALSIPRRGGDTRVPSPSYE